MKKRACRGFTLIELLIVVAIIAILAAIAIPNFLEAQTRAKVARVQSEYRNIKTAMYAYHVDNNDWPPDINPDCPGDNSTFWTLRELSTPIAYMTSVPYQDPFNDVPFNTSCTGAVTNHYQYLHPNVVGTPGYDGSIKYLAPPGFPLANVRYIDWFIVNVGPAQQWPPGFNWGMAYDASNGTVSYGTLWVSEVGIFGD